VGVPERSGLSDDEIRSRQFPGGRYTIAHWENYLLTDCTTSQQLADGLAHPVCLFHVSILGSGVDIAELFAIGGAEGPGSVGLDGYDWEFFTPLRIDTEYVVQGSIVEWEHRLDKHDNPYDSMKFAIELRTPGDTANLVARATNTWRFRRSPETEAVLPTPDALANDGGETIPGFVVESVDAQRMKTMAAILRDPYRVHWDREATTAMGLGGRVINQGPLNLSYIVNALHDYAGEGCIRRLTVAFHRPVFDGDHVVAGGRVVGNGRVDVWLERHRAGTTEIVVSGTALID
jgi:acyl dehydratase